MEAIKEHVFTMEEIEQAFDDMVIFIGYLDEDQVSDIWRQMVVQLAKIGANKAVK